MTTSLFMVHFKTTLKKHFFKFAGCTFKFAVASQTTDSFCHSNLQADWDVVQKTLIATFAGEYAFHWSLADWKYSGAKLSCIGIDLSISKSPIQRGTLMMIRRSLAFSRVEFTRPSLLKQQGHRDVADESCHPEGRVICVTWQLEDSFQLPKVIQPGLVGSFFFFFQFRSVCNHAIGIHAPYTLPMITF